MRVRLITEHYFLHLFAAIGIALLTAGNLSAQTPEQKGVVKTRGRMVNGQLVRGKGIPDAVVQLADRSVLSKKADGSFSIPAAGQRFRVKNVQKSGYQLLDPQVCREYSFSRDTLYLVMETPGQQRSDELAKERKLRLEMERKVHEKEEEIERMNVSLEEKNRLFAELEQQRSDNDKIISDLAKYYATLDYDQLDAFQRQVSELMEQGEIEQAFAKLRSRGSMSRRVQEIHQQQTVEKERREELARQQAELSQSEEGTRRMLEDISSDCYHYYQGFLFSHQNDSAAYYLELRASLDTTNLGWQNRAGLFFREYILDYDKALHYLESVLRQSAGSGYWEAVAYNNIGLVFNDLGDYSKALEYQQKALLILETVFGQEHPLIAEAYSNIGLVYNSLGDFRKALEYEQLAVTVSERVFTEGNPNLAIVYNSIGVVHSWLGNFQEALEFQQKALSILEDTYGSAHPKVASCYCNVANTLVSQGKYIEALSLYNKALSIQETVYGPRHPQVALTYDNIGHVYYVMEDYSKALEYSLKAESISESIYGLNHPDVAALLRSLGYIYAEMGDSTKALEYCLKALSILERIYGPEHREVATCYHSLGRIYAGMRDYSKALQYYSMDMSISEKSLGSAHPDLATTYDDIADVYVEMGEYAKALEYLLRAIPIEEKVYGMENPEMAASYYNVGYIYANYGDSAKALEYLFKALTIEESIFGTMHPEVAETYNRIGSVYYGLHDSNMALLYHSKAVESLQGYLATPEGKSLAGTSEADEIEEVLLNSEYVISILSGSLVTFNENHCVTATVVAGDTPAQRNGLSGEYVLLEYSDWTPLSNMPFFEMTEKLKGKPKTIVIYKDGVVSSHFFEGVVGIEIQVKSIDREEKQRIDQKYNEWKTRRKP